MKRIVIALSIIGILFTLSIISLVYLENLHGELTGLLEESYDYAVQDQPEKALESCEKVFEMWHKNEPYLISFIHHDELDEITIVTARLMPLIQNGEKAEFLAEVKKAMVLVEHINVSEKPLLKNIL